MGIPVMAIARIITVIMAGAVAVMAGADIMAGVAGVIITKEALIKSIMSFRPSGGIFLSY
jgi:hypothetical protein